MRRDYNKLVRDRIPEIIQNSGKRCAFETMPEAEYCQALLEQLVEEAQEVHQAAPEELVAELADIQEVFAAVLATWQIARSRSSR
jgi:predicted house-cleaning noncanonical NTP pyrophosphatase (MazG superfamily)